MNRKKNAANRFFGLCFLVLLPAPLFSQEARNIPLDLRLIIDGSAQFSAGKSEAINWINREIIDGMLQAGDTLTVWSAGETAGIVYSETVGTSYDGIKNMLGSLDVSGLSADFTGALKEAASGGENRNRMNVTMLIAGSAAALAPSVESDAYLFQWSRVDEFSRWQVLVVAPDIGPRVRRAAADYMNRR